MERFSPTVQYQIRTSGLAHFVVAVIIPIIIFITVKSSFLKTWRRILSEAFTCCLKILHKMTRPKDHLVCVSDFNWVFLFIFSYVLFTETVNWQEYITSAADERMRLKHWWNDTDKWQPTYSREKTHTLQLCPTQNPPELAKNWTRTSVVRRRRLTALPTECPNFCHAATKVKRQNSSAW